MSVADWSQVILSAEKPLDFLLRKGVAVYIKVRRDSEIVYRHYKVPLAQWERSTLPFPAFQNTRAPMSPGDLAPAELSESHPLFGLEKVDSLPRVGFLEEAAFLRLDDGALAEIAVSRSCFVSSFSGEGFLTPRPCEVTDQTLGGYSIKKPLRIEAADLARFEFDRAIIVDKRRLDWVLARISPMEAPPPEQFAIQIEVGESDLYVTSVDFEALRHEERLDRQLIEYPFLHKEQMPGIYWMFQAAYAHNHLESVPRDKVGEWLKENAPKGTYRYKSIRTATKFVWPEVDRASGGKGRGEFVLEDLDDWTVADDYKFPFISKGLSFVLAIADWWVKVLRKNPDTAAVTLAEKLVENKFAGLEVGDLVYLISGAQITEEEAASFGSYLKEMGKRVRPIISK
ncbi:hypothetical protein [Noviluteimonas gilva]|uniref:Uncharacterized protein n=1 Tax=Noviluteimonas gilva TaxID=2682097 RepID=A0A7C9MLA4_9GAMM|nr:hypothetical protein [Lysobacter gilvus]MUV13367.1 hypothetical protein [Lysobacter gilvus]